MNTSDPTFAKRQSRQVLLVEDSPAEAALLQDGLASHCPGELVLTWSRTVEAALEQHLKLAG